ncbi:MAG: TonB-dependent receptor [Balneolaceae bacterium]|nr:TonB-dependent receptor [Balneolaceae bacterium]MCH8548184.1 TonB-dependent receptor [Balneolaceae bacterium]
MIYKFFILGLGLLYGPAAVFAMSDDQGVLCGIILEQRSGDTLPGAVIHIKDLNRYITANHEGTFCVELPAKKYSLRVSHLGMRPVEKEFQVEADETVQFTVRLSYSAFDLDEISVTASQANRLDQPGTVNRITREGIEHIQASNLADLFELLPGQLSGTPSLTSARQSLLRQVPTTSEAARANALGTGVFVDGIPISNNANLQDDVSILNAAPGSLPPFSSVAGRGLDLREIPPDLIESLEVVQGVPSARYGDITSGAVLVESRAGAIAPQARVRFNPNVLDANLTAGFGDGVQSTGISFSGNITRSQDDPRQNLDLYTRLTGQLNLSRSWLENRALRTSLRLQASQFLDERRLDPQDEVSRRERESQDRFLQVSMNTSYAFNRDRSHKLSLDASVGIRRQVGYYAENISRMGLFPLSDARTDTTIIGTFGSSQYRNETTVEGNPLNIYTRAEYSNRFSAGQTVHNYVLGIEWKHDSNRGDGRQFDVLRPPRQNYSVGDRPRSFDDIPSLNMLSVYGEHRMAGTLGDRVYSLQAGLRFDNVSPESPVKGRFGTVLAPRLNASIELLRNVHIRSGYGVTAKAPPLNMLYPGPRYFDVVNFSNYATNPAERLAIVTTAVVEPDNSDMRAYTSRKFELGTYYDSDPVYLSLTFYRENTNGAYGLTRDVYPVVFDRFEATEFPENAPPVINPDPVETRTFLGAYDLPANSRFIFNKGLELDSSVNLNRTWLSSLSVNGALISTTAGDDGLNIDTNRLFGSSVPSRIGIFEREQIERSRLSTSIRSVHHISDLGLVVSLLAQTIWMDRDLRSNVQLNPVGYITDEGERTMIPPENRTDEAFDDIRRQVSDTYLIEERRPPLWLFNLRLSKSFAGGVEASFFANNVFSSRPMYESARSGALIRRNPPLFFGFDLSIRIRR